MLRINAPKDPIIVNLSAINPFPFRRYLWPGNTPKAVAASGAPRNIEGIESRKVCVTDIEIMKTASDITLTYDKRNGERLSNDKEIKFMWIPGVRPVIMPKKIPAKVKSNNSRYMR